MSGMSDVRISLESQLLQWAEFDDSFEQIQRWIKDMQRKTSDSQHKADLGEKRVHLQKIKVIWQISTGFVY